MKRLAGAAIGTVVALMVWLVFVAAQSPTHSASWGTGGSCAASAADTDAVAAALGDGYGPDQAGHAITIGTVAAERGLPAHAITVALATAMQESALNVLANPSVPASYDFPHDGEGTDHDSVGLFQQRPHWGPVEALMDPAASAGLFYDALEQVDGWEDLPVTVAAQQVQVSAYSDAYAKHEPGASEAAALIAEGIDCSSAWVHPVPGAGIVSGWRTDTRPSHNGVDLGAARGSEIWAAAAGEVVTARCNAFTAAGRQYTCDVDGSPQIQGCGWYVEIAHAEGLLTRYCHMVARPEVAVGDQVEPGDVLGYVGTSGRSSGPHLHLEVHSSHNPVFDTALDPQIAFSAKGVKL